MAIVRVDVVLDRQVLKEVLLLTLESWHIVLVVAKTLKDVGVVVILKDELLAGLRKHFALTDPALHAVFGLLFGGDLFEQA